MAKLYLNKLFPKLVSSLAVLLLLCQFGYVACQPTGVYIPSRNATLPDDEGRSSSLSDYPINNKLSTGFSDSRLPADEGRSSSLSDYPINNKLSTGFSDSRLPADE
ncbi:hypothetical protein H0E87_027506, partial [Populus deltoides]